jgi:integrase
METTMTPIRRKATVFPYRGKYRVQYLDTFGRQRTKTAPTQQAAYQFLAEIEGHFRTGHLNLPSNQIPQLSQWLWYWLESRKLELSPTSVWGYQTHIDKYLIPALGQSRLDQVTTGQLAELYRYLQQEVGLSPGTVRKVHALLSGVFSMAVSRGVILHSPVSKLKPPKYIPKVREVFSAQEVDRILSEASNQTAKAHLRWLLALRYGMRQGEVLGLKVSDFDLKKLKVSISRTVNSLPGKGVVALPTKTKNSRRTIPIDDQVAELVRLLPASAEWIFTVDVFSQNPIDATTDQRAWRKLLSEAGVRYLPLHSARHTAATSFIENGANPRAVQVLLGHSSVAYTLGSYVQVGEHEMKTLLELES